MIYPVVATYAHQLTRPPSTRKASTMSHPTSTITPTASLTPAQPWNPSDATVLANFHKQHAPTVDGYWAHCQSCDVPLAEDEAYVTASGDVYCPDCGRATEEAENVEAPLAWNAPVQPELASWEVDIAAYVDADALQQPTADAVQHPTPTLKVGDSVRIQTSNRDIPFFGTVREVLCTGYVIAEQSGIRYKARPEAVTLVGRSMPDFAEGDAVIVQPLGETAVVVATPDEVEAIEGLKRMQRSRMDEVSKGMAHLTEAEAETLIAALQNCLAKPAVASEQVEAQAAAR